MLNIILYPDKKRLMPAKSIGQKGQPWYMGLSGFLGMLVVVGYHHENQEGARALSEAGTKLHRQGITEDLFHQLPGDVPVEDNFFACKEVQRWRTGFASYRWPVAEVFAHGFREPGVLDLPEGSRLDVGVWSDLEDLAGFPVPPGADPVEVMRERMGDGGSVIMGLIGGLGRPEAQTIPSPRQLLELAEKDPMAGAIPSMSGVFGFMQRLGIHLRVAALTGDRQRVVDLVAVMSRLSEGIGDDPMLVMLLVSTAMDGVTLQALQEGLQCPSLTEADYAQIQWCLSNVNDLQRTRQSMQYLVASHHALRLKLSKNGMADPDRFWRDFAPDKQWMATMYQRGPQGWLDFNHATVLNSLMLMSGDGSEEGWRIAVNGGRRVVQEVLLKAQWFGDQKFWIANPRKLMAAMAIPAFSGVWQKAAKNLIMRRSAVLTCALQRHRLPQGSFPEELAGLDKTVLPEPMLDPAWEGKLLNYRRTEKGFVVWSVGEDRMDDGGDPVKDWLWVQEG
jgi:hypothetical protein